MDLEKLKIIASVLENESHPGWGPLDIKYFGAQTRSLSLYSQIDRERTLVLISQLLELERMDSESPIKLYLNTEGGSLSDAFAIYDCIRGIIAPVIIIASGVCASAGLIVLSAGDWRVCHENTTFFYHQSIMSGDVISSLSEMNSLNSFYEETQKRADLLLKRGLKIKTAQWNKFFKGKRSYYFNAKEALSYGLVNSILTLKKPEYEFGEE